MAHYRAQKPRSPAGVPSQSPCHKAPGQWPSKSGLSWKASHTPVSLGTLGKASSQHFSAETGGSCVPPAPCPPAPSKAWVGAGRRVGGRGSQAKPYLAHSLGADMLFLQPGPSGNIPRRGPALAKPPLLLPPTVPGMDILKMEEKRRVKAQLPKQEA